MLFTLMPSEFRRYYNHISGKNQRYPITVKAYAKETLIPEVLEVSLFFSDGDSDFKTVIMNNPSDSYKTYVSNFYYIVWCSESPEEDEDDEEVSDDGEPKELPSQENVD